MPKQNLIFDVGMHKGEDTDYYLSKGFEVVAFEADPDLVSFCKSRFIEKIKEKKLTIIEGAIVEKNFENKVKFFKNKKNSVWGTVIEDWAKRNQNEGADSECIEVNSINFKKCLEQFGVPYYMKIDIEGMDVVCCKTLLDFSERPKYLSIESEKIKFTELETEFNLLEKMGYNKFKIIQQDGISKQKEKNPSQEKKFIDYKFIEGSSGLFGEDLPGNWIEKGQAIKEYEKIFYLYKVFGDKSFLRQNFLTKYFLKTFRKITGIPLPGWYDTHAKIEDN